MPALVFGLSISYCVICKLLCRPADVVLDYYDYCIPAGCTVRVHE